jgi:hypothetical protein
MTSDLPAPRLREWAPSSHIILHGPEVRSIFTFSPMVIATNPDVTYFCEARVFGKDPLRPIAKFVQEDIPLTGSWSLASDEVAARCGLDTLENYIEFHTGSRTFDPPDDFIVLQVYGHYASKDGSVEGHIPSGYIYGSSRHTRRGRYYYENIPGVRIDREFQPFALTVNPFVRNTRTSVLLVEDGRAIYEGPWLPVKAKSVLRWTLPESEVRQETRTVCLITRSEEKTSTFVGMMHALTGKIASLDHMHPFFAALY